MSVAVENPEDALRVSEYPELVICKPMEVMVLRLL